MARVIDSYVNTTTEINGRWVIARPYPGPWICRVKDSWRVFIGEADAVTFVEDEN
jgi:hypothetical protein